MEVIRPDTFTRQLRSGLSDSVRSITTRIDEGIKYYEDVDTLVEETSEYVYTIEGDDPLSAEAYYFKNSVMIYQVITIIIIIIIIIFIIIIIIMAGQERSEAHQDRD